MANFIEVTFLNKDKIVQTERYSNFSKAIRELNKEFGFERVAYNTVKGLKMPFVHEGIHFDKIKIK